jgi:NADPH-dependent 2,4-dienoyl-CoA reductase/sulfur reductase-like enzyme
VVVGAGLGGLRAAEGLRGSGYAGEVVVVGDEPWMPYNRPPLSKQALSKQGLSKEALSKEALGAGVDHAGLAFRVRANAADVTWRLGEVVRDADIAAGKVFLDSGEPLGYDALVIATGVSAVRLPVPGPAPVATAGRHVVRTLGDAAGLRAELRPGVPVVVLGAGFIGCEVAATARKLGCSVRCVALDEYPMVRPLGAELGAELRRRHEAQGVVFHLGVGVSRILGDGRVTGVELADGTVLPADVVVEAVGSRCNTGLLAGQGFDLSDGVLADGALRPLRAGVPVDGVAVVGDVARLPNPRFGDDAWRVEHWNVPTDTGRRAGKVLAAFLAGTGYEETVGQAWDMLPSFWSDQYEMRLQSFGMPGLADPDGIRLEEGDLSGECVVGYYRGADLMGVVALGMTKAVMGYRNRVGRQRAVPDDRVSLSPGNDYERHTIAGGGWRVAHPVGVT